VSDYISNCPNCGAPLRGYGKCEYCGTVIDQPLQILAVRPGIRKLVCQTQIPLWIGEKDADAATEYAIRGIKEKMADALTDSIKFIAKRDFDPRRFDEVITVRGELWVADPDVSY
jgi:hypothetical protein